jgi:hypothetical protein
LALNQCEERVWRSGDVAMTSVRQVSSFESMTRGDQAVHMAEDHHLDPEPVTADELLAEHVVEHQSARDHVHMRHLPGQ